MNTFDYIQAAQKQAIQENPGADIGTDGWVYRLSNEERGAYMDRILYDTYMKNKVIIENNITVPSSEVFLSKRVTDLESLLRNILVSDENGQVILFKRALNDAHKYFRDKKS